MVICLERCSDLHMAQLMALPLTVSYFSKIQIGFTFLVPAHLGSPGQKALKQVCVCVSLVSHLQSFLCYYFLHLQQIVNWLDRRRKVCSITGMPWNFTVFTECEENL